MNNKINKARSRLPFIAVGVIAGLTVNALTALAWTGPTASPPNNNVAAPVNVGTTAQVKNGDVGVNNLSAFGNTLLSGLGVGTGRYLNFDYTSAGTSGTAASGYGIRDNAGTLEFKNLGGSWASLQSLISSFGGFWTAGTGGAIYFASGNVGIGTGGSPLARLHINGPAMTTFTGAGYGTMLLDSPYGTSGNQYRSVDFTHNGGLPFARIASLENGSGSYLQFGTSNNYATGITNTAMTIDPTGNVGVGVTVPTTRLELAQNTAIKVGQAYLSSGGDYVHLSNNEWFNGSSWTQTASGVLLQLTGQIMNIDSHTAAVGHTMMMSVSPNGITIPAPSAGGYALQLSGQVANWTEVINWPPGTPNAYGILVGTGAGKYSQFQNAEGYYALMANTSWGLYTNGNVGAAGFYYVSDRRLKKDIAPLSDADSLAKVLSLRPVSFNWIDPHHGAGPQIGFIAQDVEKIVPQLVTTDSSTTIKTVDYARVTPLLVGAMQEEEKKIEAQQKEIDELKSEIAALKNNY